MHQILKLRCFSYLLAIVFVQYIEARCWVENEDVVGAAPTGDAPTISVWSIIFWPTNVHLILEVWWYVEAVGPALKTLKHVELTNSLTHLALTNSMAPGRYGNNFKSIVFKLIIQNRSSDTHCEIALKRMPQNLTNEKSTLLQITVWCHQARSHYLSQEDNKPVSNAWI